MHHRSSRPNEGWVRLATVLVLLAAIEACWGDAAPITDSSYRTVLEGVKYRESCIQNISGELRQYSLWWSVEDPARKSSLYAVRFVVANGRSKTTAIALKEGANLWGIGVGRQGPFYRLSGGDEYVRQGWPMIEIVEDGSYRFEYQASRGYGTVEVQTSHLSVCDQSPVSEFLMLGDGHGSFSGLMERAVQQGNTRYLGRAEVNGADCHLVAGSVPSGQTVWYSELWVSPDLGWAVVKCKTTGVNGDGAPTHVWTREGQDFQEVKPGIWLPTESRIDLYRYDRGRPEPFVLAQGCVLDSLEVNLALTDADFTYEFRLGVEVINLAEVSVAREYGRGGKEMLREWEARPSPTPDPELNSLDYNFEPPFSEQSGTE